MLGIKTNLKIYMQNKKFAKLNPKCDLILTDVTKIEKIHVDEGSYGIIKVISYGEKDGELFIGKYCSIARETTFLLGGEHEYKNIFAYPFKKRFLNQDEAFSKGDIIVEDDVWIGYGTTVLSGVTIGKGAIVGANSIVTKDIPPYAIYVGNKVIKYRFEDEVIEKLKRTDLSKLTEEKIINNIDILYTEINKENVDEIIRKLDL